MRLIPYLFTALLALSLPVLAAADNGPSQLELAQLEHLSTSGSFDQALKVSEKLISRYPDNARLHMLKASLLRNMGLMSGSIEEYKRARALDPSSAEALIALSELSRQNLEFGPSLDYAREAVTKAPHSRAALASFISALLSNDRLSEAQQQLSQMLSQDPNDASLLFLSYQIHRKQGNYQEAKLALQKAISLRSNEPLWVVELADLMESMGDHASAQRCYARALSLDPSSTDIKIRLAKSLEYYVQDYDAALKRYQDIIKSDPDCVEAEAGIDRCRQKKNDLAGQLKLYLRSLIPPA